MLDGSLLNLILTAFGQLCALAALSLRKEPQYLLYNRRLVGTQSRSGYTEEKQNHLTLPRTEPLPPNPQPCHSVVD
jgi:hypothetical protein